MTTTDRLNKLRPATEYGPHYDRGVVAALSDYHLWAERDHAEFAERALLTAELRAGILSFEDFQRETAAITGKLAV